MLEFELAVENILHRRPPDQVSAAPGAERAQSRPHRLACSTLAATHARTQGREPPPRTRKTVGPGAEALYRSGTWM
jgi:hypothetical protein